MSKFLWIWRGYRYMRRVKGWANWSYVESLHETFPGWSPEEALNEDFSYWGG